MGDLKPTQGRRNPFVEPQPLLPWKKCGQEPSFWIRERQGEGVTVAVVSPVSWGEVADMCKARGQTLDPRAWDRMEELRREGAFVQNMFRVKVGSYQLTTQFGGGVEEAKDYADRELVVMGYAFADLREVTR